MQQVRAIEKNARVGSGSAAYDGTKDKDVKEAFSVAFADHGLCIIPTEIEEDTDITRWTEETQWGVKQKQSVFTKVKTKYLLLHESGESLELAGYGHGVDPQDKSAGKALTYALKNTLLYTFLTPVGKIEDADMTHSNDVPTQPPAPKKTDAEKVAIKLETIPEAKWFEVVLSVGKHAGKTLGDIAAEGDDKTIQAILTYINPVAAKYTLAVARLTDAIREAKAYNEKIAEGNK